MPTVLVPFDGLGWHEGMFLPTVGAVKMLSQVAIAGNEVSDGFRGVSFSDQHIDSSPRKAIASEVARSNVLRRGSHALDLNLSYRGLVFVADQKVVAFGIAICEMRIKATTQQFAHHEVFAGIAGWNARLLLMLGLLVLCR
jgi:hypothetical protein